MRHLTRRIEHFSDFGAELSTLSDVVLARGAAIAVAEVSGGGPAPGAWCLCALGKWGGRDLLDGKRIVRARESIEQTRRLASAGVFAGLSSGAALAGAARVAKSISSGVIVFVVSDGGWKYLSSGAWTGDLDAAAGRACEIIYF